MKRAIAPWLAALCVAGGPALAADGCPDGTFAETEVLDPPTHGYTFSAFFLEDNGGGPPQQLTCQLQPFGANGNYTVYQADYRGSAIIGPGQSFAVTSVGPNGQTAGRAETGPFDDALDFSQLVGTIPGQALDITITLDFDDGTGDQALVGVDSADFIRVAFTTWDSVKASIDLLANQRNALITHLGGTADVLLGFLQPLEGEDEVAPLVAFGSSLYGITGRADIGNGLTFLGGAGFFSQSVGGADARGLMFAGALRYLAPPTDGPRLFAELGMFGSPLLHLHFERTYLNNDEPVVADGDPNGALAGIYARLGTLLDLNPNNQLALSATLSHSSLRVSGYDEVATMENLFAADIADGVARSNAIKGTAAWTTTLSERLDLTLSAGLGHAFGTTLVDADVAFVGNVEGEAGGFTFVEYGARLGWNLNETATIDVFAAGTAGVGIGAHTQIGGSVHLRF